MFSEALRRWTSRHPEGSPDPGECTHVLQRRCVSAGLQAVASATATPPLSARPLPPPRPAAASPSTASHCPPASPPPAHQRLLGGQPASAADAAAFRAQERIGGKLRATRLAAKACDRDVAALSKAVHRIEKETLLFGDLEHYLAVIESELAAISATLQSIQETQQAAPAAAPAAERLASSSGHRHS